MKSETEGTTGFLASFRLPIPIVVERRALGLTVKGRIGSAAVVTRVPPRQEPDPELDTDDHSLAMGGPKERVAQAMGQVVLDWDELPIDGDGEDSVEVRRLLLKVTGAEADLVTPRPGVESSLISRLGDEIFRCGNRWHDVLRSWVEILTLQDLDHVHPRWTAHVEGASIATFASDGSRLRLGGIVRLDTVSRTPASRDVVERAIKGAAADQYPPLAHLLLRDARAAWHRNQVRRALLDAASATEVSLTALARRVDIQHSGKFMMLGPLVRKLQAAQQLSARSAEDIMNLVVLPRNKAIHEGTQSLAWEVAEGCKVAQREVWRAFPLWADTKP